jgi:rhodanese-related sulfurtransferase
MVGVAWFIWSWGADDAEEFRRGYLAIGPNAFEERMGRSDPFLLNVDESPETQIEGTDAFIPFDELTRHPDLPEDKGAELLIYARDQKDSKAAAQTLRAVGYEDIVDLKGGTVAWEQADKPLVPVGG